MTKYSEKERLAGKLILTDFKMFNEATVFFENHISPAFYKALDQCAERFIKASNWGGIADYWAKSNLWLAPENWHTDPGSDSGNCHYWFEFNTPDAEGNDYTLASLTSGGTDKRYTGFVFKPNSGVFGKTREINAYMSKVDAALIQQTESAGFRNLGKGQFFLPVILNIQHIAECWEENGAFPDDHELFDPLRSAMETLAHSVPLFEAIFSAGLENAQ